MCILHYTAAKNKQEAMEGYGEMKHRLLSFQHSQEYAGQPFRDYEQSVIDNLQEGVEGSTDNTTLSRNRN